LKINQNAALSVSEHNNNKLIIYPNPIRKTINFSKEVKSAGIYSLDGRKIMIGIQGKSSDLSKLDKGTYIIKGVDKEGQAFSEKVIKN
jgi:hypothetical protein